MKFGFSERESAVFGQLPRGCLCTATLALKKMPAPALPLPKQPSAPKTSLKTQFQGPGYLFLALKTSLACCTAVQQSSARWWAVSPKQWPNEAKKQRQGVKTRENIKKTALRGLLGSEGPKNLCLKNAKRLPNLKQQAEFKKRGSRS